MLSAFAKILLHSQPQDPELRERVTDVFKRYGSMIFTPYACDETADRKLGTKTEPGISLGCG